MKANFAKEVQVLMEPVDSSNNLVNPAKATPGSSGYDICSSETVTIPPGEFRRIGTGWKMAIPEGFEIQVRPRSGLAAKYGVTVLNSPGTIDSDYRGEVCVILINFGKADFLIVPGMRIAQLIISKTVNVNFSVVHALPQTIRGASGFGSTGSEPISN